MPKPPRTAARARRLAPSPIRKFFGLVESMPDAISLSIGEPDFVTPWSVREAGIFALEKGYTHYTNNRGTIGLRREVAAYLARRFGVEYNPDTEILVTVGVSEALDLACRALFDPGDTVLVVEPSFVAYRPCAELADARVITVPTYEDDSFVVTRAQLAPVARGAKALVLSYPNNPTGAILTRQQMRPIASLVEREDLLVITDEVYAELTYDGDPVSFASLPGMRERTIALNGFSKAFAMTGWRLGWAAAPADIIDAMTKIHAYTMMCASSSTQEAAAEALHAGDAEVARMRQEYNQRRRMVVSRLNAMGLRCFEPQGAFYAFASIAATGLTSERFCERLLREEKVAVVPGSAFGECGEGYVRCSYATSLPELEEALARMERFVGRCRKRGRPGRPIRAR
jgi:aminotransferase